MTNHENHEVKELYINQSWCETCGDFVDHDFVSRIPIKYLLGCYRPLNKDLSQKTTKYWNQLTGEELPPEWVKTHEPKLFNETR